jgi:hypothetical protein
MMVWIEDSSARALQRLLYSEGDGTVPEASGRDRQPAGNPGGLEHRVRYDAHGRHWTLSFWPTPKYLAAQRSWQAWAVLAAGSLFLSLLETFLLVISGRGAKVEVLVAERTGELNRVNADMKEEIAVRETAEAALRESEQRLLATRERLLQQQAALVDLTRLEVFHGEDRNDRDRRCGAFRSDCAELGRMAYCRAGGAVSSDAKEGRSSARPAAQPTP